jgi:hypothetical protein
MGCLGTIAAVVVLVAVVAVVVLVGFVSLGVIAALVVIGAVVLAVDRVALAFSPKRRARRAGQRRMFIWRTGQFPLEQVIDASATDTTVIDASATDTTVKAEQPDSEEPKSE